MRRGVKIKEEGRIGEYKREEEPRGEISKLKRKIKMKPKKTNFKKSQSKFIILKYSHLTCPGCQI